MGKFSDYIDETNSNDFNNETKKLNEEDLEKLIDKYSELDSNSLMKEFLKMTVERKKQGKLNNRELDVLKSTVMPYLNQEQKQNMEKILEIIKNV